MGGGGRLLATGLAPTLHQKCYSNEPPTRLTFCCNGHENCKDMYMLSTVILLKCTIFSSLDDVIFVISFTYADKV